MIAAPRRMTSCDFLLLGCSIAVTVVLLWPDQSDRQWVGVPTEAGLQQQYSVPINDPSLQVLKRRLQRWENPTSTRALRVARWHHELADFYSQREPSAPAANVAQVSYSEVDRQIPTKPDRRYWNQLREDSQLRILKEEQQIRLGRANSTPPVVLGPIVSSIRSPLAFPLAFLAAAVIVTLAMRRQRVRPPIRLAGSATVANSATSLPIHDSWVRIRQPLEVVIWRVVYAASVATAGLCLLFSDLA